MAVNGIYIVQGEMAQVVMALRRSRRWTGGGVGHHTNPHIDEQDPLLRGFADLRDVLHTVCDLSDMHPSDFFSPFLEVIKSEHTSGPVTGLALTAISKFLSYGLIDSSAITAPSAVEQIAEAITHARFVGADQGSDEVILMKILQVLRTLLLTPVGSLLTNTMVCEILQSCFRICFEPRLSELLRRAAEYTLSDMIQLLFTRLPTFKEDLKDPYIRKLKMRASLSVSADQIKRRKKHYKHKKPKPTVIVQNTDSRSGDSTDNIDGRVSESQQDDDVVNPGSEDEGRQSPLASDSGSHRRRTSSHGGVVNIHENLVAMEEVEATSDDEAIAASRQSSQGHPSTPEKHGNEPIAERSSDEAADSHASLASETYTKVTGEVAVSQASDTKTVVDPDHPDLDEEHPPMKLSRRINRSSNKEVSFMAQPGDTPTDERAAVGPLVPYGLPCLRELFRFLISLSNPHDKQNTEAMIQMGLNLLTIALEAGADYLGCYTLLMPLVKNELCRNLLILLTSDRMPLFAATLRACFILFEALRTHLKLHLESYLVKLMELVVSEHPKVSFEQKEMALEALVQLWRIPGLVTELYLNYDCDLYCSNLFEDLTKLLSKNSFPVAGIYSTHILSLDALLTVVETIEANCHYRTTMNLQQHKKLDEAEGGKPECRPALPFPSGFAAGKQQTVVSSNKSSLADIPVQVRPNRMPVSPDLPSHEDLIVRKKRKKVLSTGTELFNQNPVKGIAFLQEHGLLHAPLNPVEVVTWIRENPRLDKKMIGEWIANKKNSTVLKAFVESFNFDGVRIDDALRAFLETFRLVGEAPVISMILEHFAEHWHKHNGEPFANKDAAFTLAYAIIMLNTDQHNLNVRKQNEPMTVQKFKYNLRDVNGGENFDEEFLDDVFHAIKNEEIVMPAEHTGLVRENYLWKVLLRRSASKDGIFFHAPSGLYDHDLFSLIWGPTVAAISFVFDKSIEESIITKSLNGFWKCADIAAHYGMSDVFDNQVISLCKFSGIMAFASSADHPSFERELAVSFGENQKSQMAARAMFQLVHKHGDILREGWKNILECLLQLYRGRLLPDNLMEVEDFLDPKGWVSIARERTQKAPKEESGLFSSLYTLLGSSSDIKDMKEPTPEEQEFVKVTHTVISECKPEQLVTDSRYLTGDALSELLKALVVVSTAYIVQDHELPELNRYYLTFLLELMINVSLENKDRLAPYWKTVKGHLFRLLTVKNYAVVERAVVGLIRVVSRLLFREEMAGEMIQSLGMLLGLSTTTLKDLSCQLSSGLHQLLKSNAANVHQKEDWRLIFTLLEISGVAAFPDNITPQKSISATTSPRSISPDRECTSDTELLSPSGGQMDSGLSDSDSRRGSAEWTYVNDKGELMTKSPSEEYPMGPELLQFQPDALTLRRGLHEHHPKAFLKCCETLAFLVRDAAHITPENFESCLTCLRTFTEASINGGRYTRLRPVIEDEANKGHKSGSKDRHRRKKKQNQEPAVHETQMTEEESRILDSYLQVSLQILDLIHTLHVKAHDIYTRWKEALPNLDTSSEAMWQRCWRPALQAIAKYCCDNRKQIRAMALTYLQQTLLIHDLQMLEPRQWEECFTRVLFPLLAQLRKNVCPGDGMGLEESRCRALNLLCKVFLQHLNPFLSLPEFTALWVTILDFNSQFYRPEKGDMLLEAIPQCLKNMVLVMETAGVFSTCPDLYSCTVDRLQSFLPSLMDEVFPEGRKDAFSTDTPIVSSAVISAPRPTPIPEEQTTSSEPVSLEPSPVHKGGYIVDPVVLEEVVVQAPANMLQQPSLSGNQSSETVPDDSGGKTEDRSSTPNQAIPISGVGHGSGIQLGVGPPESVASTTVT